MHDYMRLEIVKRARRLVSTVYRETLHFPAEERYLLVTQMRGCAHSIGANVAEGQAGTPAASSASFVGHATGSSYELEWHTVIAGDLGYLDPPNRDALMAEVIELKRMLYNFRASLG